VSLRYIFGIGETTAPRCSSRRASTGRSACVTSRAAGREDPRGQSTALPRRGDLRVRSALNISGSRRSAATGASGTARGFRPAQRNSYECAHSQGSAQDRGRQEEVGVEDVGKGNVRRNPRSNHTAPDAEGKPAAPRKKRERRVVPAHRHVKATSTTRSCLSPTRPDVIAWSSAGAGRLEGLAPRALPTRPGRG